MKTLFCKTCCIAVAVAATVEATWAERTIALDVPLLNQIDWSGHFPPGALAKLTVTFNEAQSDSFPENPEIGIYDGALLRASLAVPAAGINRTATSLLTRWGKTLHRRTSATCRSS